MDSKNRQSTQYYLKKLSGNFKKNPRDHEQEFFVKIMDWAAWTFHHANKTVQHKPYADGLARPLLPLPTGMISTEPKIHGLPRAGDKINISIDKFYSVKRFWFDDERTKK